MRILQINTSCGIGCTGRIAVEIANECAKLGIENYIAYGVRDTRYEKSYHIGSKLSYYTHNILSRFFDNEGGYSYFATKAFLKWVDRIKPDVIHLHNIHGHYINIKMLFQYLSKRNISCVWTLHDCWAFTGHCTYFDYIRCEKWKTQCFSCPQRKKYPKSWFFDRSKNNYLTKNKLFTSVANMTIVTPSKWLGNLTKQSFLSKYPIKVIHNGIDLDIFKPKQSNFREKHNLQNKFIVLGVAFGFGERKGFKYFIELANRLDETFQVIMVGVTEEQKQSLPKSIIGILRTNNVEELVEIYNTADVFINPTLEDNFPTTNLESLACGTPVITFNTGGSIECIDETCGVVVEKENFEKLCETIYASRTDAFSKFDCIKRASLYDKQARYFEYIELYKILERESLC